MQFTYQILLTKHYLFPSIDHHHSNNEFEMQGTKGNIYETRDQCFQFSFWQRLQNFVIRAKQQVQHSQQSWPQVFSALTPSVKGAIQSRLTIYNS
jgi:hypothetical protein